MVEFSRAILVPRPRGVLYLLSQFYMRLLGYTLVMLFSIQFHTCRAAEKGAGANFSNASRSKGPHNTQFFKVWGAS